MANSGFIVINSVHNNDHGESVLLVSSLSVLIILLVVAAIFVAVHTDGQSKLSFLVMLTGEYHTKVSFIFSHAYW